MSDQTDFYNAIVTFMDTLWPTVCPFKILDINDASQTVSKYSALVLGWSGTVNDGIVKKIWKVWRNGGGAIQYASVAKSEWPAGV